MMRINLLPADEAKRLKEAVEKAKKKARWVKWYSANRENEGWKAKRAEQKKAFYEAHKDEILAQQRIYNSEHAEAISQRKRERHAANPEPARLRVRAWTAANPGKVAAIKRDWALANPNAILASQLRRLYGASTEWYRAQHEKQGGVCAICRHPETSIYVKAGVATRLKRLSVDHSHETGVIRELLCNNCNRALGLFKDSPNVLRAAADYLERHASNEDQEQPPEVKAS